MPLFNKNCCMLKCGYKKKANVELFLTRTCPCMVNVFNVHNTDSDSLKSYLLRREQLWWPFCFPPHKYIDPCPLFERSLESE